MLEGCLVDFCSWLNASFCDPVFRHARSRGDINRHSSARGNPPVTEGMLIETIDPDFLIKAPNKKIRADCLIKENAPNAPKPAPPEPPFNIPALRLLAHTPGHAPSAYSKGPEPLVIQGFGAPSLIYARLYTLTPPENSESAA